MEKLQQNYDVTINWHSFMLRPPGSPPMSPEYQARIEASRPRLRQMAREQYGIEVNQGPFGISSLPALVAEKYAQSQGKGNAFHDAVMHAYWQEARSIDNQDVLQEIAAKVCLKTDNFSALLEQPEYAEAVNADIEQAAAYGLHAVPALIFENKYLVSGAQPYDLLKKVVERIQQENSTA